MDKGKKRAVLVGCNYRKTQFKLHGCINDVEAMRDMIVKRFGFDPNNVELLIDAPGSLKMPTGANIKAALKAMVDKAEAGDVLFFHFSGHGTIIPSLEPGQPAREDEAIVPCDFNLITDMDLRLLIKQLPEGSNFTILSDSCHSGGLIDEDKEQIGPFTVKSIKPSVIYKTRGISIRTVHQWLQSASDVMNVTSSAMNTASEIVTGVGSLLTGIFGKEVSFRFKPQRERDLLNLRSVGEDEGILLSGCQANEKSADMVASENTGGKAHGAFTYAVLQLLNENNGALSNKQLVMKARKALMDHGFQQHPCLYCSDGNVDATFLGTQHPGGMRKRASVKGYITNLVAADETVVANHEPAETDETMVTNFVAADKTTVTNLVAADQTVVTNLVAANQTVVAI